MMVFIRGGGTMAGIQAADEGGQQAVDEDFALHPGERRMQDQDRCEPVDSGPERLAGGFYIERFEDAGLHAIAYAAPKMIECLLTHAMAAHAAIGFGEGLEFEEKCDAIIVGVGEAEFDVCAKPLRETGERIGRGFANGGKALFQLLQTSLHRRNREGRLCPGSGDRW